MNNYSKEIIIEEINNILKYHKEDIICLKYARMLMNKVIEEEEITLSKEEIEKYLFIENSNEINKNIFNSLKHIKADLSKINFNGKIIHNLSFSNLKGVVINIDKIPNKDLSNIKFEGVKLVGKLNNSIIKNTDFTGYIGNLSLTPSTLKEKTLEGSKLSGITINGFIDNIKLEKTSFKGIKGEARINPQRVPNKELIGIDFSDIIICGEYDSKTRKYNQASFDECKIYECSFKNAKGKIKINLDTIKEYHQAKLVLCDLTNVIVEGTARSNHSAKNCIAKDGTILFEPVDDDLYGSYYYNELNQYVEINLYQSTIWDKENLCCKYITREKEPNLRFNVEYKNSKNKKLQKTKDDNK